MMHYVCPECGHTADHAKVCETDGCSLNGHDMKECNCADGEHTEVMTGHEKSAESTV